MYNSPGNQLQVEGIRIDDKIGYFDNIHNPPAVGRCSPSFNS